MKKMYLIGLALSLFTAAKAQTTVFSDDFESHNVGSYYGGNWKNWSLVPNTDLNIKVSSDRASSGTKSGYIGPQNAANGQDALLMMPTVYNQGVITAEWKMFVPSDSVAYYNLQEEAAPGGSYGFQCYINTYAAEDTLTGGESLQHKLVWTFSVNDTAYLYAYSPLVNDQWFTLKQVMDFDNSKLSLYVDGVEAVYFQPTWGNDWPGEKKSVASFDFFSYADEDNPDLYNAYYIDDVTIMTEGANDINNISKNSSLLSLFPNPASNSINLSIKGETITNVEVLNVAGQTVLSKTANASSATLNIQSLAPGIYTAKVLTKGNAFTKNFVVK